ncbi:hypothetical protein [Parasitella parasitica]|uniref:Uncharacterized protein n=1 Tax=Parasitella parasitica TaxID=35722 RepID=A0A0B7N136_9FUNG|nr:hypothetical protein [Parasitella parasitica]
MLKKWKSILFSSNTYLSANDETQREGLLEPEERDVNTVFQSPHAQHKLPLLIYWFSSLLLITSSTRFAGSDYQDSFQNYFSAYFNCSNLITLAVLLWIRQRKNGLKIDPAIPLAVNSVIFLFFAISSLTVPAKTAAVAYFWTTIACMIITGMTTSIIQLTILAETSQMLPKYMQAVMSGQGIAGVSVSLFSLVTTLLFNSQQLDAIATFYYFSSALLVTLIAILGRFALLRQPAYQLLNCHAAVDTIPMTFTMNDDAFRTNTNASTDKSAMWDIITQKSAGYIFTIVYIYMITLALFPSVTVLVRSVNGIDMATFISFHFLLFNIGDWIGRTLPIFISCQRHDVSHDPSYVCCY